MITLHTFGRMWDVPDPSPFVMKAEMLLKLSGVPFTPVVSNLRGAPKGKLPYIEDAGTKIADSTFIRLHLEQRHGVDFDAYLSERDRGIAWAVEKLLEDNFYWVIVYERWMIDANFDVGPRNFFNAAPKPLRPIIATMVRRLVRKNLHAHGLGRHSREDILLIGKRAIDALAAVLGDSTYLLGDRPCGADATAFAFAASALSGHFDTPLKGYAAAHPNLVAYCRRMREKYYS